MVALAGFLALAVDGGRLYLGRRQLQTAADGAALAGAQDLVNTVSQPSGSPPNSLYNANAYALKPYGLTPTHPQPPGDGFYASPPGNTITDSVGAITVTVISPTGYNNKRVKVTVSQTITTTFAAALGFGAVSVKADAVAEAGTNPFTYALFAYTSGGSGNTINDDQNGYAQIDNGQNGADACNTGLSGLTWSNAKFHVPNPTGNTLNVNGYVTVNSASDTHGITQYWVANMPVGTGLDAKPDYQVPDVSSLPVAPARTVIAPGTMGKKIGKDTFNNSSAVYYYVYSPGQYTSPLTIPLAGDAANGVYIFQNGLYYFSGANFTITGNNVSNTSDGKPKYSGSDGITDLASASDGTNGVEFILDLNAKFSANNTSTPGTGSVFFVAPSLVPTGTTEMAFFIPTTNTVSGTVWSETFSATSSNAPRFQIWGSVFDGSNNSSSSMTLTAVQVGPRNLTPSSSDSSGQYAVNGEFIAPTIQLNNGNVQGNATGTPASCPAGSITPGSPGLLTQYNPKFAPAPGVNSYLVK
jgi:hypothetical protein